MTDPYRLPRTVTPRHYALRVAPDLDARRFDGTAGIEVTVHEPITQVVLNAVDLSFGAATIRDAAGIEQDGSVTIDREHQRATISFPRTVHPGEATLTIAYSGILNDQLRGFYRSTFAGADGQEYAIATTQFESTDARRAFPCWDEPEHKATFQVTLRVPKGLIGLSNTPVVATREAADGGSWVTFGRTIKMSTYLVAFIVGPLAATEPRDVDGVPLRVVSVPGRERLASFALAAGAHALRFFADYFAIPYPGEKLDLVAIPDFAAGAMENLGLVTFRETALLVNEDKASRPELERVADVVAHEIAHMWFGDLVTMKWWNGIWLNEAFATFMSLLAVDDFRPSWHRWTSFNKERGAAMVTDGLVSTRPIEYEVRSPDDAKGMFDGLTYIKGAAVLRMLEQYLGGERFRAGIRLYLDRHRYGTTETTDLWDAIEEATGEPVRAIMDSWIFQGGHPVVTAAHSDGMLRLSQMRFRYLPSPDDEQTRWQVPLIVRSLEGSDEQPLLLTTQSLNLPDHSHPEVVNAGGWGVFRTHYEPSLLVPLTRRLGMLQPIERLELISDTWAMAQADRTPLSEYLDLVALLADERDPTVWEVALEGVDTLHRELEPRAREGLASWLRGLVRPSFDALGWEPATNEDDDTAKLRATFIATLGTSAADDDVVARARTLHAAMLEGSATIAPDVLGAIVSILAWNGSVAEYSIFWEQIRAASTPQDEVRYLFRLPLFPSADLLLRTLEATLGEIRSQNGGMVIAGCLANRWHGRQAWNWLTSHWEAVLSRLPENAHGTMLEGIPRLTDPSSVQEVAAFLEEHPIAAARRRIAQLLERQQINAAFAARQREAMAARFSS
jgi:puromycin-sensitive aminopeptidase